MADNDSSNPPPPPVTDEEAPPPPQASAEPVLPAAATVAVESIDSKEDLPPPEAASSEDAVVVAQDQTPKPPPEQQEPLEAEAEAEHHKKIIPHNLVSFKEESNRVSDLSDSERTALQDLKQLLADSLLPKTATTTTTTTEGKEKQAEAEAEGAASESDASTQVEKPPQPQPEPEEANASAAAAAEEEEVSIWGVPLLKDERSDVILLKFLRARDFKVKDAFSMINNTLRWRKDFNIDALLHEDLGDDLDKVVFMHGHSREGHPVCYNVYGEFQNKELYHKTFSTEERRTKFLRWRIQFLERSIRNLDFNPGGVNTIFQVNDLKNSPGPAKRELRLATKQALQLLQDNYPEFVNKQVFINVPWWYLAFYTMISPFLTQRTKSKFVFAGPSKSPDTLFKYISPEQVPIQYGGLSVDFCDCNPDFSMSDPITEVPLKPTTKQTVEIAIYEKCIIVWELRVVGWEVSYSAEFKPDAPDGYTVIIQKATKMSPTDEPVVSNSFKVGELGKLLLTIDNPTLKKKRLLYRFKIKPYSD